MRNKKVEQKIRTQKYLANAKKYNQSFVAVYGCLLAIIDHVEDVNEVMPELFSNNLKYVIEDTLNKLYEKSADPNVAEEHNTVADKFREVIETL